MTMEIKRIDLQKVTQRVVQNLNVIKDGVQIKINFDSAAREVYADEDKIQQVMTNLLSNAIKYSDNKKRIWVTAWVEGEMLKVSVKDEGMGIHAEDQERIFQRFERADSGVEISVKGTGLGLAIVKKILESNFDSICINGLCCQ